MRTIHMCISVRGMLNWSKADAKRNMKSITKSDGTRYRDFDELRHELMDELARGHEVIPLGELCEGFDYKTGCPGHEQAIRAELKATRTSPAPPDAAAGGQYLEAKESNH